MRDEHIVTFENEVGANVLYEMGERKDGFLRNGDLHTLLVGEEGFKTAGEVEMETGHEVWRMEEKDGSGRDKNE